VSVGRLLARRSLALLLAVQSTLAVASYVEVSDCPDSARRQLVVGTHNGIVVSSAESGQAVAIIVTNLDEAHDEMTYDWRYRQARRAVPSRGTGQIHLDGELAVSKIAEFIILWRADKTSPALLYCPNRAAAQLFPKSRFEEMP
jgi:hypothetical protein